MSANGAGLAGINTSVPNVARIYDYILGGKDNFAADRRAAQQLLAALPDAARTAQHRRRRARRSAPACRDPPAPGGPRQARLLPAGGRSVRLRPALRAGRGEAPSDHRRVPRSPRDGQLPGHHSRHYRGHPGGRPGRGSRERDERLSECVGADTCAVDEGDRAILRRLRDHRARNRLDGRLAARSRHAATAGPIPCMAASAASRHPQPARSTTARSDKRFSIFPNGQWFYALSQAQGRSGSVGMGAASGPARPGAIPGRSACCCGALAHQGLAAGRRRGRQPASGAASAGSGPRAGRAGRPPPCTRGRTGP